MTGHHIAMILMLTWIAAANGYTARHPLTSSRVPPCSSAGRHHERWAVKNRTIAYEDEAPTPITFAELLARPIPTVPDRDDPEPIPDFEQTFFHLTGAYACLLKQSPDDCDLHLELAASAATCLTGPRIIVEVPARAGKEAQNTALDAVGIDRLGTKARVFTVPPPVQVFGWGFFDLSHRCTRDAVRGCQHGSALVATLAELHPARVEAR